MHKRSISWARRSASATLAAALATVSAAVPAAAATDAVPLRQHVLAAPADALARIGRHVMVGFEDPRDIHRLIEARAIAGVFIGRKNVGRRSAADLKALVEGFQRARAARGDPPLWIAADQEGGMVQRLSPPLPRLPALARVLAAHDIPAEQEAAVTAYGRNSGRALASIGVNVNFAPVVDVDFGVRNPDDEHTRISRRALAADAPSVAQAAGWYCAGLRQAGVRCTRKHFPGLGRVYADTHVKPATLAAPLGALRTADWIPFHGAASAAGDWAMLGHVRLAALDAARPASASREVIGVLRNELGHAGVVITDDLSMGAVKRSDLGVAGVALGALDAGADMLLISFDPTQIYVALHALLAADAEGRLDRAKLAASVARLDRSAQTLTATHSLTAQPPAPKENLATEKPGPPAPAGAAGASATGGRMAGPR